MWTLAWRDSLDGTSRIIVDPPALDLAEVKIVDGRHPAQQLAIRTRQRSDLVTPDVMDRVRLEVGETNGRSHRCRLMRHDQIIGDGGDVHAVEGSGSVRAVTF